MFTKKNLSSYALIVDARSPREYAEDHLPGAVNLPVVTDAEYAAVGTLHKTDKHRAYLVGVSASLRNIAVAIDQALGAYPPGARILVYCSRGGKRSKLWFDALHTIGFRVERVAGGWKSYRNWVNRQLAELPQQYRYRVLCGPTGCGKTRLLQELKASGEQVLDLEAIARHRGSLIGAIPGEAQPSQKWFDSQLVATLAEFDPARPVWLESESKKIGAVQLPLALFEAMHASTCYRIEADMTARVSLWREDYRHFEADPYALLDRLEHIKALVGNEEFVRWMRLAEKGETALLFERLMTQHYDPAYRRSIGRHYPQIAKSEVLHLSSLEQKDMRRAAETLIEIEARRVDSPS